MTPFDGNRSLTAGRRREKIIGSHLVQIIIEQLNEVKQDDEIDEA
jgi:hypothetical protein